VFHAQGESKLTSPTGLVHKPAEILESPSVSASFNAEAKSYIVQPTTFDPFESDFSLTVLSEHIQDFKQL